MGAPCGLGWRGSYALEGYVCDAGETSREAYIVGFYTLWCTTIGNDGLCMFYGRNWSVYIISGIPFPPTLRPDIGQSG